MKSAEQIYPSNSQLQTTQQLIMKNVQKQTPQEKNQMFYQNVLLQEMNQKVVMAHSLYFDESLNVKETLSKEKQTKLLLKELQKKIKILQEQKESLKEDIEFLLLNFGFIFELGKKNIAEGLNKKSVEILQKKNIMLNEKREQLKKYEIKEGQRKRQSFQFEKLSSQLKKVLEKNEKIVGENAMLKNRNRFLQQALKKWEEKQIQMSTKSGGYSMKELYEKDEKINERRGEFKVKKTKTQEFKDFNIEENNDEHMKSLGRLKFKINRLKSQLAYGVKLQ